MHHARALAHYSNMARMAAAQRGYDNQAEPENDGDPDALTELEAEAEALTELMSTPASFAQWLAKATDTPDGWRSAAPPQTNIGPASTDVEVVRYWLLGSVYDVDAARRELQRRFAAFEAHEVAKRAADLMRGAA